MDFNERTAREAKAINDQDECDDPDCACHQDAGERPGDGAAEVTMTEVYEDEPGWDPHPRLVTRCGLETPDGHSK